VINQALMRVRKQTRDRVIVPFPSSTTDDGTVLELDVPDPRAESPSDAAVRGQVRKLLEQRIDELPEAFRVVFVMREVEELTARETAEALGIPEATVRTRLFRARALLREALDREMDTARGGVFSFDGARCDRIVATVLARIS
jgi:RNA polymerase sigma-70 factor (ECF subfamily)